MNPSMDSNKLKIEQHDKTENNLVKQIKENTNQQVWIPKKLTINPLLYINPVLN